MRAYKVKPIEALGRGIDVLLLLQDRHGVGLAELHRTTGLSKASLIRILHTLHRKGLVWQRIADGAYLTSHRLRRYVRLDDPSWLVEIAAPILEELCQRVSWPSVLSIPRADHMEVIETNSPKASFDLIVGPIGAKVDLLRSSSGRAFLAFCSEPEREAAITRLQQGCVAGPRTAWDIAWIEGVLRATRERGYSVRARDYGGIYNDDRNSIAMPVIVTGSVLACVNLTWRARIMTIEDAAALHSGALRKAVRDIEAKLLAGLVQ